jgi:LCP family protein required for cell wall assembly
VLLSSALGWLALESIDSRLQREDVGITGPASDITDQAQNILLVGSDNREGLTRKQIKKLHLGKATAENGAGRRSDTMILMHLSKERDQVTLVSLPRDSYVRIPSYTDDSGKTHPADNNKLNAAFALGGPKLAIKTIEQNTGVHIDHYVEVNFLGFVSMVDALGGVSVCVKKPIHDQKSGLDLAKGRTKLDGAQGLAFVRARYFDPRADIGRIERQQQFLGSMFRTAISGDVLLNPAKLSAFLDATLKSVVVDDRITRNDMVALAGRMKQIASGNVDFMTVPIADYDYRDGEHGSSVRWDRAAAEELFSKLENDQEIVPVAGGTTTSATAVTVPPGQVTVQVLNGAGITGLARRAADDLARVGFAISGQPANAATSGATTTIIAYDPRYDASVKTVAAALPGSELKEVPGQGSVIQVILGSDYTKAVTPSVSAPKPTKSAGSTVTTAATSARCR